MRQLLQDLLSEPSIQVLAPTGIGVHQGESVLASTIPKPFLVYTVGNATNENLSEEDSTPERQFFQVYVHDKPADYTRIDQIVIAVKAKLKNVQSAEYGIITIRYLETSRDLDDNTLGTIMRYIRFQAIKER